MDVKVKNKKCGLLVILLLILNWNCKEKVVTEQPLTNEVKAIKQISPEIKELLEFANIRIDDTSDIEGLLDYKLLDENGTVNSTDLAECSKIYKNVIKGRSTSSYPIFEITGTDKVIFVLQNRGFSGPIWAQILIDTKGREFLDIQFGHIAEAEGYGAGITQTSFRNQFVGKVFKSDSNEFGLNQNGKVVIEGTHMIDGISGATITSNAAVNMINQGLQKLENSLD